MNINGEQHYHPVKYSDNSNYEEQFKIGKLRDNIKRKYCVDNNIILIEIPYWQKKNMKKYLLKQFKNKNIIYQNA